MKTYEDWRGSKSESNLAGWLTIDRLNVTRILAAVIFTTLIGGASSSSGAAGFRLLTPGVLTVATGDFPVPGYWNGSDPEHPTGGLQYALAEYVGERLHLKVVYKKVDFATFISGQYPDYDIFIDQITPTPTREKIFDFSLPYTSATIGLMVRRGTQTASLNDIRSLKFGSCTGCAEYNYVVNVIKPYETPNAFSEDLAKYQALATGQISAVVGSLQSELSQLAKPVGKDLEVPCQFAHTATNRVILVRKTSGLTQAVNDAVAQATKQGLLDRWTTQYIVPVLGGIDPKTVPTCAEH